MKRVVLGVAILIGLLLSWLLGGCGGKKCLCGAGEVTKTYWHEGMLVTTHNAWACKPCISDFEVK